MIDIQEQWAIQIDITNLCGRNCSNCTRLIGHVEKPFFMSLDYFEKAIKALKDFPDNSPKSKVSVANKVIGIIGGEPLLHPQFPEMVKIINDIVPEKRYRGLWTSSHLEETQYESLVRNSFGYINHNQHITNCIHSPVLVAIKDVIDDEEKRKELIDNCWLQRLWSGSITPKGLFFCEVAGAMDMLFDGPGGLPVEPECWKRPLTDFQEQINQWCPGCGIALNLKGRKDTDQLDDITTSNLRRLRDSPRIRAGKYKIYDPKSSEITEKPWEYLQ